MSVPGILLEISYFTILLPLTVVLTRGQQLVGPYRILAVYVLVGFVLEAIMYYTSTFLRVNNLWVVHLYAPLEFFFLSAFYFQVLSSKKDKKSIIVLSGLVLVISVLNAFVIGGLLLNNTYACALASGGLILYALFYFYQIFRELRVRRLERDPVFLLSVGSLLYFSGSISINSIMNALLAESMTVARVFYMIERNLDIIFKICLVLALWQAARQEMKSLEADAGAKAAGRQGTPALPPQQ